VNIQLYSYLNNLGSLYVKGFCVQLAFTTSEGRNRFSASFVANHARMQMCSQSYLTKLYHNRLQAWNLDRPKLEVLTQVQVQVRDQLWYRGIDV